MIFFFLSPSFFLSFFLLIKQSFFGRFLEIFFFWDTSNLFFFGKEHTRCIFCLEERKEGRDSTFIINWHPPTSLLPIAFFYNIVYLRYVTTPWEMMMMMMMLLIVYDGKIWLNKFLNWWMKIKRIYMTNSGWRLDFSFIKPFYKKCQMYFKENFKSQSGVHGSWPCNKCSKRINRLAYFSIFHQARRSDDDRFIRFSK